MSHASSTCTASWRIALHKKTIISRTSLKASATAAPTMYPSHAVCSASGVRVSVWGEEIGPHFGVLVVELHGEMMMMMIVMMMIDDDR